MSDILDRPAEAAVPDLLPLLRRVAGRVAPLWPLQDFVAVNPFLGLAEQPFGAALARLSAIGGVETVPPRAIIAEALAEGRVTEADLAAAIAETGAATTPEALAALARSPLPPRAPALAARSVADVLDATQGGRWRALAIEEIAKWCAAWCDEGQAAWPMPWRGEALYGAWRAAMRHDRTPEAMGVRGFRATIAALPQAPAPAIAACLARIGLAPARAEEYLHRCLLDLAGWAGFLRQRGWKGELAGDANDQALELLAIRCAWDVALLAAHGEAPGFRAAWAERLAAAPLAAAPEAGELALQAALEKGFQRTLARRFATAAPVAEAAPAVQAAFCIDVRSELYRRALEGVSPRVATLGFAGFFGFALEYVRLGDARGAEQCPVLLRPGLTICEALPGRDEAAIAERRGLARRVADLWASFRASAVSSFAYVETAGFLAAGGLLKGLLRRKGCEPDGLDPALLAELAPSLEPRPWHGRPNGIAAAQRLEAAEAVLRAMSLTRDFAPLVLLCGHGGSTVNNPHAAGLDCGACGGHTGESNARVAALVLNDPDVRAGLAARGIAIPSGTRFVAALHDTTTDEVTLFDAPEDHPGLAELRGWLAAASARARAMRAPALGLAGAADPAPDIRRRSADWSEVRPEWALANNAAFIVAPRARTRGLDLEGRAFLHSYVWQEDEGFAVLELIMTAPMVVANWINLQYYGSMVDNAAMGSGNKTLHNVVGRLGVLEGQGGDLRPGLPMQSLHDGRRWMHEPLRLHVLIEAPEAAIEAILAKHAQVRNLVENGWLHLFQIAEQGRVLRRYHGPGRWEALETAD
jgi:uncharacterized protein YbcC (UPF0753/DUF2309 family)